MAGDWLINGLLAGVLILAVGAAILYIRRSKKKGVRCIGCPHAGTCGNQNHFKEPCRCSSEIK